MTASIQDQRADNAAVPMRIRLLASCGQLACLVSLTLSVLLPLIAVLDTATRTELMSGGLTINGASPLPMNDSTAFSLTLIGIPMIVCECLALVIAFRLFSGFKHGEIFTRRSALRIAAIGLAIFALLPLALLTKLAAGAVVSADTLSALSMRFTIADFDPSLAAFGLLLILIGKVMEQAALLSDENRQFV